MAKDMIYEFEIHNRQTQETKYLCFETDTLENAEVCLEKDVSIDQEHSTYELNRVISPIVYSAYEKLAIRHQQALETLREEGKKDEMLKKIANLKERYAIDIDQEIISVCPTLDPNFKSKK